MSNKRQARFWIHAWWPVVFGVAIIAFESSPQFGTNRTSAPLRWLWQSIFGPVSNQHWDFVHMLIRKTGHFLYYGMLGLAWLRAWRISLPRMRLPFDTVLAVLGTAVIASCDEFHQTFIPNRRGSPWDVLLDCCGAATLCLLACAMVRFARPKQNRQLTLEDEPNIVA